MRNRSNSLVRALSAGVAGAALVGSVAAPTHAGPIIKPPIKITLPADLRVDSVDATPLGGLLAGYWQVKATLRNYAANYAGGGTLVLSRSSGGMVPVAPPYDLFPAVEDQGEVLAKKAIPAMGVGQTLTVQATTRGRAIFSAVVQEPVGDPDSNQPKLPESPKTNNRKELNVLLNKQLTIDNPDPQILLGGLLSQIQLRLDKSDSFAKLPGVYDSHWKMDEGGLMSVKYHYSVHDLKLQSIMAHFPSGSQQRLNLDLTFETQDPEIKGTLTTSGISTAANFEAPVVRAKVALPLTYHTGLQYFFCSDQPEVTVVDTLAGLPGSWNWVQDYLNAAVINAVTDMFKHPRVQQQLEYELNHGIRERYLKDSGRIVNVTWHPDEIHVTTQVAE